MHHEPITVGSVTAVGYAVPLRPGLNLVFAVAPRGLLACGAFDPAALEKFQYAAALVKSAHGGPLASVAELLDGSVRAVNPAAAALGLAPEIPARAALAKLG